ncbi:hypothetical protein B0J11DRAFT_572990 [Dendryphion nanum]|uniref:Uncharacterized protein n=1 Tax=Dendryphion nanum TaxID=256645 RepID=A0A9P9D508_9PLEO|nr:hypothetical protein B0J11DRAFT_572990 [Dendryphion nanum]
MVGWLAGWLVGCSFPNEKKEGTNERARGDRDSRERRDGNPGLSFQRQQKEGATEGTGGWWMRRWVWPTHDLATHVRHVSTSTRENTEELTDDDDDDNDDDDPYWCCRFLSLPTDWTDWTDWGGWGLMEGSTRPGTGLVAKQAYHALALSLTTHPSREIPPSAEQRSSAHAPFAALAIWPRSLSLSERAREGERDEQQPGIMEPSISPPAITTFFTPSPP